MSDLISRQAAIDTLHMDTSIIPYKKAREYADATILEIRNRLEKLPSAQSERTGRWEQVEVNYFADMDEEIQESMAIASMLCPRCKRYHNEVYLYGDATYGVNFCPNCGADMRGEQE